MYLDTTNETRESTILFADVFGYSVLMEQLEQEVCILTNHGINLFANTAKKFQGRVREIAGDGLMIEFYEPESAVCFALECQQELAKETLVLSNGERILFRVGVHTGPVIVVPSGVRGHTVNVAARLQAEVKAGEVGISESTLKKLKNPSLFEIHDVGHRSLKNIQEPFRLFIVDKASDSTNKTVEHSYGDSRDFDSPPTIVLSPLNVLSDNPEMTVLSRAVGDELIHQLTLRNEFLTKSGSIFSYEQYRSDIALRLCRLFSIDYLLEGSLRKVKSDYKLRIRIASSRNGLIIDSTDYYIRHDCLNEDTVAAAVKGTLRCVGIVNIQEATEISGRLSAGLYSKFLLAKRLNRELTEESNRQAISILTECLRSQPENAGMRAELAHSHHMAWRYSWGEQPEGALEKAIETARLAIAADPENAKAYSELGYAQIFTEETEASLVSFKKALDLTPNDPWILADFASLQTYLGNAEKAIKTLEYSIHLNSNLDLDWRLWSMADAYFPLREYENVVSSVDKMRDPTEGLRLKTASLGILGRLDEARIVRKRVLERNPNFRVSEWMDNQPDTDLEEAEHYADGLRRGGLPN